MLLRRAAKGTESLSSHDMQTGIIFGLVRCIKQMMLTLHPQSVIVCWDGGLCRHRQTRLPGWRKRPRLPDEEIMPGVTRRSMWDQAALARDLLVCLGVRSIFHFGFECDDLVAMCVKRATGHTIIHTRDHDYYQLLTDHVTMFWEEIYSANQFRQDYGFEPFMYPLYQALVGKPGNGIMGVKGIGKVTAKRMMHGCRSFSDWETGSLSLLTEKQVTAILDHMDKVRIYYHVSIIPCKHCEELIQTQVDQACLGPHWSDFDKAQRMIDDLEMRSLLTDETFSLYGELS